MPGPVTDFVAEPALKTISIERSSVQSCFHSLLMLVHTDKYSGLSEWMYETETALSDEEKHRHELVMIGLHYAVRPQQEWNSFPEFIEHLTALPSRELRDRILRKYHSLPLLEGVEGAGPESPLNSDDILRNEEDYLAYLAKRFPGKAVDNPIEREAYQYLMDPAALQKLVTSHLKSMWVRFLAKEWDANTKVEKASVEAFRKFDFTSMSKQEVLEFFSGQPVDLEKWKCMLENAKRMVFIPSIHMGPYLGYLETDDVLYVIYGARAPEGVHGSDRSLSHAELIVRLNALSDDQRLRILKTIADEGEMKSQEVIDHLNLSQSTASRHLKQLSATGFLTERRCEGAKCYRLSPERIEDTLQAIRSYLLGEAAENR